MSIIVIHGGAGTIREDDRAAYQAGLEAARDAAHATLDIGGDALSAAIVAVRSMEDDAAAFNAGTGASPTRDGRVECDAAVMTSDGSSGAVAALTVARNPILVADKVRRETPHALFVGAGADALVDDPIDNALLLTARSQAALARWRERHEGPVGSATVGAVVCDAQGRLAAATSTGGVLGQWAGRVGDSPLIGAGTYADERLAVSCTGKGEAFMRAVTAKGLACALERGVPLERAVAEALAEVGRKGGDGGLICVTADGRLAIGFTTPHMAYGWHAPEGREVRVGLEPGVRVVGP